MWTAAGSANLLEYLTRVSIDMDSFEIYDPFSAVMYKMRKRSSNCHNSHLIQGKNLMLCKNDLDT